MAKRHFPLNLSKFKKISADKSTTILQNSDGHEIKINHEKLSPKARAQLAALPVHKAQGGKVEKQQQSIDADKKENYDEGKKTLGETIGYPGAKKVSQEDKENNKKNYAQGGQVQQKDSEAPKKTLGEMIGYPGAKTGEQVKKESKGYADGGEVVQQPQAPVVINVGSQLAPMPPPQEVQSPMSQGMMAATQGAVPVEQPMPMPNMAGNQSPASPEALPANPPQPQVPNQARAGLDQVQMPESANQQPKPDPFGVEAYSNAYMQGLNEEKLGLAAQAAAEGQMGKMQADALQKSIAMQQAAINTYNKNFSQLQGQYNDFIHDVQNQHIQPDRYWNNKSTGSKIATILGVLVSGLGGAQENMAMSMLNKEIDRDIDAQKAELGKKQNLLSANMHQFGNINQAAEMTRAMQQGIIANQLQQKAALMQDPLMKAKLLQQAGRLDRESAQIIGQTAMKRTLLQGAANGQVSPDKIVNLMVPEAERGEAVKELSEYQNLVQARDNVLKSFDEIAKLQSYGNRLGSPIQSKSQIEAYKAIIPQLSKATAGRYTEEDAKALEKAFPHLTDTPESMAKKRAQVLRIIQDKMTGFPKLQTYVGQPVLNSMGHMYNAQGVPKIRESAPIIGR